MKVAAGIAGALLGVLTLYLGGCGPFELRPEPTLVLERAAGSCTVGLRVAADGPDDLYDAKASAWRWVKWPGRPGLDTRDVVLSRSMTEVELEPDGEIAAGRLVDPYTGETVIGDPKDTVEIDHVIPKALAARSGLAEERRREFANDLGNLRAVAAHTNGSKSDRGPEEWLPAQHPGEYARTWAGLARDYGLTITPARHDALERACATA